MFLKIVCHYPTQNIKHFHQARDFTHVLLGNLPLPEVATFTLCLAWCLDRASCVSVCVYIHIISLFIQQGVSMLLYGSLINSFSLSSIVLLYEYNIIC